MNKVYPIFNKSAQQSFELLLKTTNKRNYTLWLVGTHTGLRVSDILTLRVKDVSKAVLIITELKTGKSKRINISNKLKLALNDYIKSANLSSDDLLFTSRQSKSKAMTRQRVHQIIKKISSKLDIKESISTHSMRKTFAYNLYVLSNNNIALVMQALNHTKEAITLRYLCIQDNLLNELVNQF